MSLECELDLKKPISLLSHRAILNVYYTASQLRKKAEEFFHPFFLCQECGKPLLSDEGLFSVRVPRD